MVISLSINQHQFQQNLSMAIDELMAKEIMPAIEEEARRIVMEEIQGTWTRKWDVSTSVESLPPTYVLHIEWGAEGKPIPYYLNYGAKMHAILGPYKRKTSPGSLRSVSGGGIVIGISKNPLGKEIEPRRWDILIVESLKNFAASLANTV